VLAKVLVGGVEHVLLHAHRKWGDWSLVGGHVEPTDRDWLATATREVEEEMTPLRCGSDLEVVPLELPESEWGPVPSVSAGGAPTRYRARWYVLRFKSSPRKLLDRLPRGAFKLVPIPQLHEIQPLAAVVDKAQRSLCGWEHLPLSWDSDIGASDDPVAPIRF